MRLLPMLLALPLLAFQAHAQTAPPLRTAPAPAAPAANAPAKAAPQHQRMTWKQHFAQANLAHDGHLTLQEANGGYPTVAHHFTEIDADKKGYVTEEDITNWHKLQRATHHSNKSGTDEGLQPHHAFQQGAVAPRPLKTSADGNAMPMTQPDATPADQQTTAK